MPTKRKTHSERIRVPKTLAAYTAKYTKLRRGYMGELLEWPEVITEGKDLEDCRESLRDALREMILAYRDMGRELPPAEGLFEPIRLEV